MTTDTAFIPSEKVWKTKLCSWGTSQAVRIPKEICEEAGLALGDELDMQTYRSADSAYVSIRNAHRAHRSFSDAPRISLRELLNDYSGDYRGEEPDWGQDIGAETIRW